jgi:signal peptidase I
LVQQELHPEDEGRESDRNPGQPAPDPSPAGVSEAVAAPLAREQEPTPSLEHTWPASSSVDPFETSDNRFDPRSAAHVATADVGEASPLDRAFAQPQAAAIRAELDDRSSVLVRRLELWRDEFVAWVKTLASAAVYATLIVTFGFQVARVEGQSMAPTLADQDRLIVNKLAYRLADPQRGDIVMLYYPLNPDKSFVKRVIAEEGDAVRIVDGRVYVNDVPLRDEYVPPEYRSHDDWGPQVIPEGYYFVMGDHRNNSSDSRHWNFVPKKYIIGKVQIRWWPVPNARVF